MKLSVILEANLKAVFDKRYTETRDALGYEGISKLMNYASKKISKKAHNISPENVEKFKSLKLLNDEGRLGTQLEPFFIWLKDNTGPELDYVFKRADANDALTRGHLKRDNDWMPAPVKQGRKIVKSLSNEEKKIFGKLFNRFLNPRTRSLAKNWGNIPEQELRAMQERGILNQGGILTDKGEFAVKYYVAFRNDPDGLDRVPSEQRVGNYGAARQKFISRVNKILLRAQSKREKFN